MDFELNSSRPLEERVTYVPFPTSAASVHELESKDSSQTKQANLLGNRSCARTQVAANHRFSSKEEYSSHAPLKDRYTFKNWVDVLVKLDPNLYAKIVKALYLAVIRQIEIERIEKRLVQYWQKLEENFRQWISEIQQS